jgi:hypothetical protein
MILFDWFYLFLILWGFFYEIILIDSIFGLFEVLLTIFPHLLSIVAIKVFGFDFLFGL